MLPALLGPDKDPLQGLQLSDATAWGGGEPQAGGRGRGPASEGDLCQPPPSVQVRCPTGGLQSQGAGTSWASQGKGVLLYSCHSGQSLEPEGTMVSL